MFPLCLNILKKISYKGNHTAVAFYKPMSLTVEARKFFFPGTMQKNHFTTRQAQRRSQKILPSSLP